ncbi:hypothetical protein [Streptomyces sp. NPDC004546]|uniref:hypothetical protein n=1 Tax=Streptomyces sp. NPDC004546 TaxID=3154282 RepID=UPI0033B3115B
MAAIKAVWDDDTVHDWFVCLVAVLEEPDGEGHLATVRVGGRSSGEGAPTCRDRTGVGERVLQGRPADATGRDL